MACGWEGFPYPSPDVTRVGPRAKLAGEGGRVLRLSGPWAAVRTRTIRPLMSKQRKKGTRKVGKAGLDSEKGSRERAGAGMGEGSAQKGLPQEVGLERTELN